MKTGSPYPLGATVTATGVNFSVFSYHATRAELLLFDTEDAAQASRVIDLVPGSSLTSHYWHVHLPGIKAGQLYGFRLQRWLIESSFRLATPRDVIFIIWGIVCV